MLSIPRARIHVLGDEYEATHARAALARFGATVLTLDQFLTSREECFGFFFHEGLFLRPTTRGYRPCNGILRIRETEEELQELGVPSVPDCLRGGRGFVACRLLTDKEAFSSEGHLRFMNALREAERVCTRKTRYRLQETRGRKRPPTTRTVPPAYVETHNVRMRG